MTYCVVRTVYYGPERTMRRDRMLNNASFDEARKYIAEVSVADLHFLHLTYGGDAFTEVPIWPAREHLVNRLIVSADAAYRLKVSFSDTPTYTIFSVTEEQKAVEYYLRLEII